MSAQGEARTPPQAIALGRRRGLPKAGIDAEAAH